jgi:hypothetical protein
VGSVDGSAAPSDPPVGLIAAKLGQVPGIVNACRHHGRPQYGSNGLRIRQFDGQVPVLERV